MGVNSLSWKFSLLVCFLVVSSSATAGAQQAARIAIYVDHAGDDAVGPTFAYAVREAVNKSSRYALAAKAEESQLVMHIVTVDSAGDGHWTAAAISLNVNRTDEPMLDLHVMVVGSNRTATMARRAIAAVDRTIDRWRQAHP